jgi:hypothetical protein
VAKDAIAAAEREGRTPDPALVAIVTMEGQKRGRAGCVDEDLKDKPVASIPTRPAPTPDPKPAALSEAERREAVMDKDRVWIAPSGKSITIPKGHALVRMCPTCELEVRPRTPGGDIRDEIDPRTGCGKLGLGWVSPWCEEMRAKRP